MIEFFGRFWVQNWHFSYFLCHCFPFLHNPIRVSIPWLFRTCFHIKIFNKCNFRTHYNVGSSIILIESLKFRNNSRIAVTSPSNLLWKVWILKVWSFRNIMLCYYFSLEAVLKAWLKITLPKNKSIQQFRRPWSMRQCENSQKRKMQSLSLQNAKIDLNYKLQLLAFECH